MEPASVYTQKIHVSCLKSTVTDKWSRGLKCWEAILIIPLKMRRVFVNINFPEPKGASSLVCHLFTGPESCTLKPNRPLSDPRGKELQLWPLTLIQQCPPPPLAKMTLSTKNLSNQHMHRDDAAFSSPFFFRKALLVASGLWRTFGFWRNFTAVLT